MTDFRAPGLFGTGRGSVRPQVPKSLSEALVSSFTPEEAQSMFEGVSFDQPTGPTLAEILGLGPDKIPDPSLFTDTVPADRTPEYRAVAQREEMERLRARAEEKDALVRMFMPHLTEQERKDYEFSDYEKELMEELGLGPGLGEGLGQMWDTTKAQGRRIQEAWREKVADIRSPTEADTAYVDYMRKAATGISSDRSVLPTIQQPRGGGAEKREGILEDLEASQQINLTDPTKPSNYPEVVAMVDSYKPRTPTEHSAEFWQNFGLWLVPNFGVAKAFTYAPKIPSAVTFLTQGVPKIIGRGAAGGVIDYNRAKLMGYSDEDAKLAGVIGGTMGVLGQTGSMFARWLKRQPDEVAKNLYHSQVNANNITTGNSQRVHGEITGNVKAAEEGQRIAETSQRVSPGQVVRELGVENPSVIKTVADSELANVSETASKLWTRADELAPDINMVDKIGDADAGAAWFHFNSLMERYARQTHRGASALKEAVDEGTTALPGDAARAIPDVDPVIDAGRAVWAKVLENVDPTKGVDDVLKALNDLLPSDWASIQKVLYRLRSFEDLRLEPAPEVSQVLRPVQNKIRDAFSEAFKGLDGLSRDQVSWTIAFGNQADEATRFFRNPIQSIRRVRRGERPPRVEQQQVGTSQRPQSAQAVPVFQPEGTRTGYFTGKTLGEQIRNATERQQALLELGEKATAFIKTAEAHKSVWGGQAMQWLTAGAAGMTGRMFLTLRATGAGFLPQVARPDIMMQGANLSKTFGTQIASPFGRTVGQASRAYQQAAVPDFRAPGLFNPIKRAFRDYDPTAVATPPTAAEVLDEETPQNFYEQAAAELPSSATTVPEEE